MDSQFARKSDASPPPCQTESINASDNHVDKESFEVIEAVSPVDEDEDDTHLFEDNQIKVENEPITAASIIRNHYDEQTTQEAETETLAESDHEDDTDDDTLCQLKGLGIFAKIVNDLKRIDEDIVLTRAHALASDTTTVDDEGSQFVTQDEDGTVKTLEAADPCHKPDYPGVKPVSRTKGSPMSKDQKSKGSRKKSDKHGAILASIESRDTDSVSADSDMAEPIPKVLESSDTVHEFDKNRAKHNSADNIANPVPGALESGDTGIESAKYRAKSNNESADNHTTKPVPRAFESSDNFYESDKNGAKQVGRALESPDTGYGSDHLTTPPPPNLATSASCAGISEPEPKKEKQEHIDGVVDLVFSHFECNGPSASFQLNDVEITKQKLETSDSNENFADPFIGEAWAKSKHGGNPAEPESYEAKLPKDDGPKQSLGYYANAYDIGKAVVTRHPEQEETWKHGQQVTWNPEQEVTRRPGQEVAWNPGQQVSSHPGQEVTWNHGHQGIWNPGQEANWNNRQQVCWNPGQEITSHPGQEVTWNHGQQVTWNRGQEEIWSYGQQGYSQPGQEGPWHPGQEGNWHPGQEVTRHAGLQVSSHPRQEGTWNPGQEASLHQGQNTVAHDKTADLDSYDHYRVPDMTNKINGRYVVCIIPPRQSLLM